MSLKTAIYLPELKSSVCRTKVTTCPKRVWWVGDIFRTCDLSLFIAELEEKKRFSEQRAYHYNMKDAIALSRQLIKEEQTDTKEDEESS